MRLPRLPRLLAVLVLAGLAAGCDLPSDPVPTNPYDPLFDGPRTPTSPVDIRFESATPGSLTIAWTDRSSFETGFQVQRSSGISQAFVTIATVPPNTTTYTDSGLISTIERRYRILAVAERVGAPADTLDLRVASRTVVLDALEAVSTTITRGTFSVDGGTLYAIGEDNVQVVDAQTGQVFGSLPGVRDIVGVFEDGRVAGVTSLVGPTAVVQTYVRTAAQSQTTLSPGGTNGCVSVSPSTVRLSADGQTLVGLCLTAAGTTDVLGIWTAGGGPPVRTLALPAGARGQRVDLTRDGTLAVVSAQTAAGRLVLGVGVATGAVRWTATTTDSQAGLPLLISPDGTRLIIGGAQSAALLSTATGATLATNEAFATTLSMFAFSPDGQQVGVLRTTSGTISVAGTSDLVETRRLDNTRTVSFALPSVDHVVGFRVARQNGAVDYDIVRWDLSVPLTPARP